MSNVFAIITEQILRNCGGEPICAHVGDVQVCAIKKHPTYQMFRRQVRLDRSKSIASLRLWESVVTLAREGNQQEREKWLLIALDLLTPYFEGWSKELARQWHYEVSDIRSAIIEGLLEAWSSTADGVPSKKLRDDMMTRAFARARSLVDVGSSETCTDSVEFWISEGTHWGDSTLRASSIINASTVRNPDADERIRGERIGALLQRMGAMGHAKCLHSKIRDGCRNETHTPAISPTQVGRSWVDGGNLYYRFSDLLPQHIGFKEAASTVGFSESHASRKARKGSLPFRVLWIGNSRAVSVKSLMHILGIQDSTLHPDDVENGASHIGS
ncbi:MULTISPECIES: hypothetical protein [unclassified Streptomyces]|uniref:hypothetical protein n=1 Tax=unclassified Streptomyces TaxID=2593676 RepID=UPI000A5A249A|nr:hypothetical protein [Streptomyces sp. TSRI0281]